MSVRLGRGMFGLRMSVDVLYLYSRTGELQEWDDASKKALAVAYSKVRPSVQDFWAQVAKLVSGKVISACLPACL